MPGFPAQIYSSVIRKVCLLDPPRVGEVSADKCTPMFSLLKPLSPFLRMKPRRAGISVSLTVGHILFTSHPTNQIVKALPNSRDVTLDAESQLSELPSVNQCQLWDPALRTKRTTKYSCSKNGAPKLRCH